MNYNVRILVDDCVVFSDVRLISGEDVWTAFLAKVEKNQACCVRIANSYSTEGTFFLTDLAYEDSAFDAIDFFIVYDNIAVASEPAEDIQTPNALIPAVMIDGTVYYLSQGSPIPDQEIEPDQKDTGYIESEVSLGTFPQKDGESNYAPAGTPYVYCRPPGFTVVFPGKYLAGGLQSGCTANLTGAQYKIWKRICPEDR